MAALAAWRCDQPLQDALPDGKADELIAEFKARLAGDMEKELADAVEDDPMIIEKTLVARDLDVDKAEEMFRYSTRVKKEKGFELETILSWTPPEYFFRHVPAGVYGEDREGHPVVWMAHGWADPKGLYMMASVEEHLKYKVWQANLGMLVARRLGFKHNKYIRSLTTVIDLQGLGTRHAFRPFLSIFNQGNKLIQSLYPEVMHQIVIINAPTIFTVLFPLVKAFLSKRVISKIRVISETDYFPLLAELIDPQYIPKYLGGTAPDPSNDAGVAAVAKWFGSKLASETWAENEERRVVAGWDWKDEVYAGHSAICIGGDVPEELYLSSRDFEQAGACEETILAGGVKEVPVVIDSTQTEIRWSFKTRDNSIGCSLHYKVGLDSVTSEEIVPLEKHDSHLFPVHGVHECGKTGVYVIRFDNSDSWFSSKHVSYHVNKHAKKRAAAAKPPKKKPVVAGEEWC